MGSTFYITTPIYYVNDDPHVGHAYTTVAADFVARWHRLSGRDVFFLTGTDEHGQKMAQAAGARGLSPKEHCDAIVPRWKAVWDELEVSNDDFIRTTDERHRRSVFAFMERIRESGDVYLGSYEGPYCVRCEEYKTEAQLDGANCAIHGSPVEILAEDNWFFRLSAYEDKLRTLYTQRPQFVQPLRARNELLGLLAQGLRDVPISRPTVSWGIPLPWDTSHSIYVWIEALQNYITAAGFGADDESFARLWPADVHLVGKEIVRFHAVIWPAMLMAAGLELPRRVFAHGWLLAGGEKISKSGRNITQISPHDLVATYGADAYRYHFLRAVMFGDDGNFSLEDLEARYTADLANDLGNLASRVVAMIGRYFNGYVPSGGESGPLEHDLLALIDSTHAEADALVHELRITEAVARVFEIVRAANRYLVVREPWKLAKDASQLPVVAATLHASARALQAAAAMLFPAMPSACRELWRRLGLEGEPHLAASGPAGRSVVQGPPLFPRLERE